jgi:hypothetical protein
VGLQLPTGVDDLELFLDADRERLLAHRNLPALAVGSSMPAEPPANQAHRSATESTTRSRRSFGS